VLDSQVFSIHFRQIEEAILQKLNQGELCFCSSCLILTLWLVPSVVCTHFCQNWQRQTLNHGDELRSLWLCCIQPYSIHLADHSNADGRHIELSRDHFNVLSMFHETKVVKPGVGLLPCLKIVLHLLMFMSLQTSEPEYNFVLPHRDPLCCAVGALAVLLHYVFDHQDILRKQPDSDWSQISTWNKVLSCKHG
jgi:hypothetical protein